MFNRFAVPKCYHLHNVVALRAPLRAEMHSAKTVHVKAGLIANGDEDIVKRQLRARHWLMLSLAICIVAASFALRFNCSSASLRLPWSDAALPATCGSRLLFGVECPGCGLTRSFVALAAGDFRESFHYHRLGWLLALAVVVQVPYRLFALCELRQRVVSRPWPAWIGYALVAALVMNWLLKTLGV
jgi:hypothetical protein